MDEPAAPKLSEQKPVVPTKPPKHHMPTWLKLICWGVVILVGGATIYFIYAVITIVTGLTTISSKCTDSQNKATTASKQYADTLNNLGVLPQPYKQAQPAPSGDCIDTAAHTADATLMKTYSTPQPLTTLNQEVKSGLQAKGYSLKSDIALQTIQTPTDPVDVDATYSKAGQPDLNVTYIVGHNPDVCDSAQDTDAYPTCIAQYENSFKNLSIQEVSEVDLELTKDFPNNY